MLDIVKGVFRGTCIEVYKVENYQRFHVQKL